MKTSRQSRSRRKGGSTCPESFRDKARAVQARASPFLYALAHSTPSRPATTAAHEPPSRRQSDNPTQSNLIQPKFFMNRCTDRRSSRLPLVRMREIRVDGKLHLTPVNSR